LTVSGERPTLSAMAKSNITTGTAVASFERALDELEQLVQKMEKGEQSLDESLAAYERGVALYRECQKALEQAELRVRLLSDPQRPDTAQDFPPVDGG
jgi:exodeoxyribonuclease VII small subunit